MPSAMVQDLAIGKYGVSFMGIRTVALLHQVSTVMMSYVLVLIISHQAFGWVCMMFCLLPSDMVPWAALIFPCITADAIHIPP
jgi:hypothetical protein